MGKSNDNAYLSTMAMKPETRWDILNNTFLAYQEFRKQKGSSHRLSYIDLLYVSNFKGGNASIGDAREKVDRLLKEFYQQQLNSIRETFGDSKLQELTLAKCEKLSKLATVFVLLTKETDSKIRGFGVSWASALLALNFPDLLPVLDRRVLAGAGIEAGLVAMRKKGGQVKHIETHYLELLERLSMSLHRREAQTLRELDRQWFIQAGDTKSPD